MKIVLCTGGYDPLHAGHIAYLSSAAKLGDVLVVGVNSDAWLQKKKGHQFMDYPDRRAVVENIHIVDAVVDFDDSDGSAIDAIVQTKKLYPNSEIIFANGGDRTQTNIPEYQAFQNDNLIHFEFAVGGDNKINSSSDILKRWIQKNNCVEQKQRTWGWWRVFESYGPNVKLKELIVSPGEKLSMQKHKWRSELWFVAQGQGTVHSDVDKRSLMQFDIITIKADEWHQLENTGKQPLHIIEIQWGKQCSESDIIRKD